MRWFEDLDDQAVWIILLGLTATALGVALAFEHIGGFQPCPLCYLQRWPYYALIALSSATLLVLQWIKTGPVPTVSLLSRIALAVAFLLLIISAGLGAYHSGVEWKWWPGPDTCAGGSPATATGGSLIERMQATRVVRCDDAQGRFLGLSFAGYNALFSAALAIFIIWAFRAWARRPNTFIGTKDGVVAFRVGK